MCPSPSGPNSKSDCIGNFSAVMSRAVAFLGRKSGTSFGRRRPAPWTLFNNNWMFARRCRSLFRFHFCHLFVVVQEGRTKSGLGVVGSSVPPHLPNSACSSGLSGDPTVPIDDRRVAEWGHSQILLNPQRSHPRSLIE